MTDHDLGLWPVDATHLVLTGIESTHEFRGLLQSVTHRSLTIFTDPDVPAVRVTVDVSGQEPPAHVGEWDEVVETTVRPTGPDDVVLVSIVRARPRGERLLPADSGTYRLRIHQTGRVTHGRGQAHVHLAFWPARPGPARVLVGDVPVSAAARRTPRHPDGVQASARDQSLQDDMTRRLIERARRRQGG